MYLITGAAGKSGGVSRSVVEMLLDKGEPVRAMVHREDARAQRLRDLGAQVVVGDLTDPRNVVDAMTGVERMFFNMSVSLDYLEATAIVCATARELGGYDVIVNMSQMTVSQMTLTSTEESHQQWLHWLSEEVMNWSGVPVVHIRPTVFLDNPLFTMLARRSVHDRGVLPLPFGTGRTSPISAVDVARVVVALLLDPADRIGNVYELTGPEVLDMDGLAEHYARALGRPVTARGHTTRRVDSAIPADHRVAGSRPAAHLDDGEAASRGPLQPGHRRRRDPHRRTRSDGGAVHRFEPRAFRGLTLTARAPVADPLAAGIRLDQGSAAPAWLSGAAVHPQFVAVPSISGGGAVPPRSIRHQHVVSA